MEQPPYWHSLTMNQPAVTGRTVSLLLLDHEGIFHRGPMAAQAIVIDDSPGFVRQLNRRRVIPQAFVVNVPQTCLGLVGEFCEGIRIGHVAFNTGE